MLWCRSPMGQFIIVRGRVAGGVPNKSPGQEELFTSPIEARQHIQGLIGKGYEWVILREG